MKPLIKVMLIVGAAFATTFVLGRLLGILTVENVRHWLELAQTVNPLWVAATVIFLLFIDIFVAVPTLALSIMAGFFLGFPFGFLSALTGVSLAAFTGFALSRKWGNQVVVRLVKDEEQRLEMADAFARNGPTMIVLSRAAPMVPELTSCLAGATGMNFFRYVVFFLIGTVPYVGIATYAGSISSPDSPKPAIFAVLFLYGVLWIGWYLFRRRTRKAVQS